MTTPLNRCRMCFRHLILGWICKDPPRSCHPSSLCKKSGVLLGDGVGFRWGFTSFARQDGKTGVPSLHRLLPLTSNIEGPRAAVAAQRDRPPRKAGAGALDVTKRQ